MGNIQIDFGALQAGHAGVQNSFTRLQATLDELEAGLRPMVDSWSGAAQEAYVACKQQWEEAAQSLAAVLQSVSQAVAAAHDNYSATHGATIQIWS